MKLEPHVANFNVDGGIPQLERVAGPDRDLPDALREFLCRNPHRHGENPSWLSVALWSEEYVEGKPPPVAVEVALAELEEVAA